MTIRPSRLGTAAAAPLFAAIIVAACGSGPASQAPLAVAVSPAATSEASAAPASSAPPTSTPSPAASPSAAPTLVASPVPLCSSPTGPSCAIEAGAYTTTPSADAFRFAVPAGWSNDLLDPGGGELISPAGTSVFWVVDPGAATRSGKFIKVGRASSDIVDHLSSLPGATASSPVETTLGGLPATQLDVTPTRRDDFALVSGHVGFGTKVGTRSRYFIVPRDGDVAVVIVSTDGSTTLDEATAEVQPVLDSIAWQ